MVLKCNRIAQQISQETGENNDEKLFQVNIY
jgi:hypothetical protein